MKHEYITVAQAAILKRVSRTTIYKAVAKGQLKKELILGRTALRRKNVDAWEPFQKAGRRPGTSMSDQGKARISEGQKRRWAQLRQEKQQLQAGAKIKPYKRKAST